MRATALLGLLSMVTVAGCPSGSSSGSKDPTQPQAPPLPIALDWVGFYIGTVEGTERGEPFRSGVFMTITFSSQTSCPQFTQPDAVTIRLQTSAGVDLFRRCNLVITSSIEGSFSYVEGKRRHTLKMGRFSGGGGSGESFLGDVQIEEQDSTDSYTEVFFGSFTAVRRGG